MKPALTAEEWAELEVEWESEDRAGGWAHVESMPEDQTDVYVGAFGEDGVAIAGSYVRRHALAALCLHGQPFGFTRADMLELHVAIGSLESRSGAGQEDELRDLADRLSALLPPEEA